MDTKQFIAEALNPRPRFSLLRCLMFTIPPAVTLVGGTTYWFHIKEPKTKVLAGFVAQTVNKTPFSYSASIMGEKLNDCQLMPDSAVGWSFNGVWREVGFSFLNDATPNSSRPTGFQSFGVWQWKIKPTDSQVRLSVQHMCEDKVILSIIGPFKF